MGSCCNNSVPMRNSAPLQSVPYVCKSLETPCFTLHCAGAMSEQLQCQAANTGGGAAPGGAKPKPVFDVTATAEVAAPLLQLSKEAVEFSYIHADGQQPLVMQEPLEVR